MVQALMKTDIYQSLDKGHGDGKPLETKRAHETRGALTIKWKIILSSAILLTSIFVFTGTIIYLNLNPANTCRKGCITVHIIPYMQSSLNRMTSLENCNENDMHDSFEYVVNELEKDERRRFTITEMYPFWRWWKKQTKLVKSLVRLLVNEGRIEIAGGGWCVPDEALVYYRSFIDQFTWGLRRLEEISGRKISPDVAFLMDNRGHSREIASLLREMDFRGAMLGGISPLEQCHRRTHLRMEFLWSDGDIFGVTHEKPNLFTSILDDRALKLNEHFLYGKPVIDLNDFVGDVLSQSRGYATNHVFMPVGGNFQFNTMKDAFGIIESVMNLTKYNSKYKLNVVYSTPSGYLNSVDYNNDRWRRSNAEFLPYVQGKFDYWTGYYSFRSSFRYYQRIADRFLQVLKQLITLSNTASEFGDTLTNLRESVGLSQHHHASTAPSGHKIAEYFHRLLSQSVGEAQDAVNRVLRKLTAKENRGSKLRYESCLKLNVSECAVTERSEAFVVTVYNPSHRIIDQYVRIPVTGNGYLVRTSDGQSLTTQLVDAPQWIRAMPNRDSKSEKELVFRASKVPALGFKSYYVSAANGTTNKPGNAHDKKMSLAVNELTRKVSAVVRNGVVYPMAQELKVYNSWFSNDVVFRPRNESQAISDEARFRLLNNGELVTEYEQTFGPWASQTIRIYKDEDFIEYNWVLGPVPINFFEAKEIVTSFTTSVRNGQSFYVDSNGRGFVEKFSTPEMEDEQVGERIARNYHPVNPRIAIADPHYQLHVFNDRVQGGSSPFEGQLELMLHRKFMNLAVLGKRGNQDEIAKEIESGRHWVFIGSSKDHTLVSSIENFSSRTGIEPWYFFADASNCTFEEWRDSHISEFSGVQKIIPKNLRVLTLEPWAEGQVLLRLENIEEDSCDKVRVNLQQLFSGFIVTNATQVSLAGKGFKETFNYDFKFGCNPTAGQPQDHQLDDLNVFIHPSQIKTFLLGVKPLR